MLLTDTNSDLSTLPKKKHAVSEKVGVLTVLTSFPVEHAALEDAMSCNDVFSAHAGTKSDQPCSLEEVVPFYFIIESHWNVDISTHFTFHNLTEISMAIFFLLPNHSGCRSIKIHGSIVYLFKKGTRRPFLGKLRCTSKRHNMLPTLVISH